MTSGLSAICFGAGRPEELARFWGGVLGWRRAGAELLPGGGGNGGGGDRGGGGDGAGFRLRFRPSDEPKTGPNRMHFDLTSTSPEDQQRIVARALDLGARHIDVGQGPEDRHVVLADPDGNEFCVIEADNEFLAGCGVIGALSCDGSREVGYFWSAALGWPLVWDQNEETAIQSPRGGTKITWGGPPVAPKSGPNRLSLELAPAAGAGWQAEVDRLVALGAARTGGGAGHVEMTDPDGNEFRVLASG